MNIEKLFYTLRSNKKISLEQLYAFGATDVYIGSLVGNEILKPINDTEYDVGQPYTEPRR